MASIQYLLNFLALSIIVGNVAAFTTDPSNPPRPINSTNISIFKALRTGAWNTIVTTGRVVSRHEACYVRAANGNHYLIGGRRVNNVGIYNPTTKTWTDAPGPGVEIHHMQCVATPDGRIWIPSSWFGRFPFESNHEVIWIFNTNSNTWSTLPGLPEPRRRGGAAAVLHNGMIYVSHGNRGGHGGHAESLAWLDAYDIEKNIWTTDLPNGPTPRDHTGGGILDGRLCVAGGRDGGDPKYQKKPVRETDCYNFDTGMWSVEKKMPVGRAGSAYGVTCGGMLAVAGGEGFGKAFDQVHFFNGKRWFWGPKLQRARHGSALAIHSCECGQISIASGSGGQGGGPELRTVETLFNVGQTESCR